MDIQSVSKDTQPGPIISKPDKLEPQVAPKEMRGSGSRARAKSTQPAPDIQTAAASAPSRMHTQPHTQLQTSEASASQSRFLANMSHEIRTPLTAILGFTDLALDSVERGSDLETTLVGIRRNSLHLLNLITDLLDLEKVEAGRIEVEYRTVRLQVLMDEVIADARLDAREKNIKVSFLAETDLPDFFATDPLRLRQILSNLMSNAVKFTNQGQIVLHASYRAFKNRSFLDFGVEDTGVGISKEAESRLFLPFMQIDSSLTRQYGGTGLGLVLARRLANLLGGDVSLKSSSPGNGSTFVASVEILDPRWAVGVHSRGAQEPVITTRARLAADHLLLDALDNVSILLVEDSIDNQTIVSRFLRSAGAKVDLASNGREGAEKGLVGHYMIILMDIQMPEVDGYEAFKRLRDGGYKGRVLALTAHALESERRRARIAGFDDYLTKPLSRQALVDAIRRNL